MWQTVGEECILTVLNPIKRIYVKGDQYYKVCIEVELPTELELQYNKAMKIVTLETGMLQKDEAEKLFDMLLPLFGITLQKSNLTDVTFVNMFCSDKDAKLSEMPQPIIKQQGVLL